MMSMTQAKTKQLASDIQISGLWARLPKSWHAYVALMRLDRPIGWWLLLLPSWWVILISAPSLNAAIWLMMLFLVGAIVMRAAGCVINDMLDTDIDKKVARTKGRPIASGQISLPKAWLTLIILAFIGLGILLQLPLKAWIMGILSLPLIALYPLFKRFTYWPQAMLGLTFSWGIFLGYVAASDSWPSLPIYGLYLGSLFWVIGYDTIYAIQDMEDDAISGVKSSALALRGKIRYGVRICYGVAITLLTLSLYLLFSTVSIWLMGPVLMGLHCLRQTSLIAEDNPKMALALFQSNRDAGLFLVAALLAERLL